MIGSLASCNMPLYAWCTCGHVYVASTRSQSRAVMVGRPNLGQLLKHASTQQYSCVGDEDADSLLRCEAYVRLLRQQLCGPV